jgi:hypothetical protein
MGECVTRFVQDEPRLVLLILKVRLCDGFSRRRGAKRNDGVGVVRCSMVRDTLAPMMNLGAVPDWITAGTAVVSLPFLVWYAWSAKVQATVAVRQSQEGLRPILVVTSLRQIGPMRRLFTLENQGAGAAFDVVWQAQGDPTDLNHRVGPSCVLGPGATFEASFDAESDTKLTFLYHSTFGEKLRSEVLVTDLLFTTRYYPHAGRRTQRVE